MEILHTKTTKGKSASLLKQIFPHNGVLVLFLLGLGTILFVGGTYVGIKLDKTRQASTILDIVRGVAGEKLNIVPNYLGGLTSDPIALFIDLKNNDYQKLAYLREKALAPGSNSISKEIKDEEVPGDITVGGTDNQMSAKFSLTGVNFDHIGSRQKWSLRTNLKGDNLILGMNKFTLLVPEARARPPFTEWLNHRLEKSVGLISLNYEFVKVVVNGKNLGIYALEEHFDKRLLERNGRREGIIIKLKERDFELFKPNTIAKNPKLVEQARTLDTLWEGFWAGDIPAGVLFDVDKLAKYYALSDLVNGRHTHYVSNEFFYLNPITRLLEPIAREWASPYMINDSFRLFVEDLNPSPLKSEPAPIPFAYHSAIFRDTRFVRHYFQYLRQYSSSEFLNAFIAEHQDEIDAATKTLHSDFPYYDISAQYLFDQVDYIGAYLDSDFSTAVTAYLSANEVAGEIIVRNDHHFPLQCEALRVGEEMHAIQQDVQANGNTLITLPVSLESDDAHMAFIKCVVPGIAKSFEVKIFPWQKSEALAKNRYPVSEYADNDGILSDGSTLTIPSGLLNIDKNLVVSSRQSLTVMPGAHIDLTDGAFILSYGALTIQGTEAEPVRFFSSDSTGRGVVVLNANDKSVVSHAEFSNMRAAEFQGWSVTAAVLFNESEVSLNNVSFLANQSEDALNIVRSKFEIKDSLFSANKSDAFDSDFSRGTVSNTRFLATGNDAIDTSGSKIEIRDILISGAGDKGVSVGEASVMRGKNLTVQNSGIAISSKDNSTFEIENISLDDNALAFALYQKKAEYGPTHGIARGLTITGEGKEFIVEKGSSLQIDDTLKIGDIDDVNALMYGNVYGKKTVR